MVINMHNNLQALLAISIGTNYKNIKVDKVLELSDKYEIFFTRKINDKGLLAMNQLFNISCNDTELIYKLNIMKPIFINNIQIELLTVKNIVSDLEKVKCYENKIVNRLMEYRKLLYETIAPTDNEIKDYTFYYISKHRLNIGFANTYNNPHSIKIDINQCTKHLPIPTNVLVLRGTENDAKIFCLRRKFNSKYCNEWKYCELNSYVESLLFV